MRWRGFANALPRNDGEAGDLKRKPGVVHVLVDVKAAVLVWIGVDAALEVDPLHALGAANGPPAALDRHRVGAGRRIFLDQ